MSQTFKTYEEAFKVAQESANKMGMSYGLEKGGIRGDESTVFLLPQVRNRYGHELRCQVVYPMLPPEKVAYGYEGAGKDRGGPW